MSILYIYISFSQNTHIYIYIYANIVIYTETSAYECPPSQIFTCRAFLAYEQSEPELKFHVRPGAIQNLFASMESQAKQTELNLQFFCKVFCKVILKESAHDPNVTLA